LPADPHNLTDAELVARCCDGAAAFSQLVERYQNRLLRYLLSRAATRADAEDALQEAFIKAYKHLNQYDSRWAFSTWLFSIASRELMNIQRRRVPQSFDPAQLPPKITPAALPADDGPPGVWRFAKQALADEHYAALWLFYAEDMAIKEISRALGRSQVWVKVTLHRARHTLKKHLDALDPATRDNLGLFALKAGAK